MKNQEFTDKKSHLLRQDLNHYLQRVSGEPPSDEVEQYRLIDLFSGAGGMTLGFSKRFNQPFKSVWANDNNEYCVNTYNRNFDDHCLHGDIVDILKDTSIEIPKADVVIGGPPCQGFSLLNKNRDGDPRKQLWRPYMEVVKRSGADVFVMENVPHLIGTPECDQIVELAESSEYGFKVKSAKLLATDYGVPQTRLRAFIIGCKHEDPGIIFPPKKTHFNPGINGSKPPTIDELEKEYIPDPSEWMSVSDAIRDLSKPIGTQIREEESPLDLHFGRNPTELSKKRYRAIPKEGMNRFDLQKNALDLTPECWINKKSGGTDLFGRLWWKRPAFTIRTEFFKPEKGRYLHPEQHRPITHREAARFQGFPDDFIFLGSKIEIAKQIGNAVPPPLAARVADVVRLLLKLKE